MMLGWWGGAGFWGLDFGRGVRWCRFVRICPVFWIFGGYGRVEGLDGVSPPGSAAWFGGWVGWVAEVAGWLGLLASFFVVLLFQIQKHSKKVRDASRSDYVIPASRPSRKLQAVPGEGFSRAAMVHDCARSPSRWMSTFESRPKTRLCGHRLLCDSRR